MRCSKGWGCTTGGDPQRNPSGPIHLAPPPPPPPDTGLVMLVALKRTWGSLDSGIAVHNTDTQTNNQEYRMINVYQLFTKQFVNSSITVHMGSQGRWFGPRLGHLSPWRPT